MLCKTLTKISFKAKKEGANTTMKEECISCQREFDRSRLNLIMPWQEGSNPNAFWRCSSCGCENIEYGFGEDD